MNQGMYYFLFITSLMVLQGFPVVDPKKHYEEDNVSLAEAMKCKTNDDCPKVCNSKSVVNCFDGGDKVGFCRCIAASRNGVDVDEANFQKCPVASPNATDNCQAVCNSRASIVISPGISRICKPDNAGQSARCFCQIVLSWKFTRCTDDSYCQSNFKCTNNTEKMKCNATPGKETCYCEKSAMIMVSNEANNGFGYQCFRGEKFCAIRCPSNQSYSMGLLCFFHTGSPKLLSYICACTKK